MWPRSLIGLALVSSALGFVSPDSRLAAGTSAVPPVLVGKHGFWSFKRLGYDEQVLLGTGQRDEQQLRYRLPAKVAQGPREWFLLHLKFRVRVNPQSGTGTALVEAAANRAGVAQTSFYTRRTARGLEIEWGSVSIVDGGRRRAPSRSRLVDVTYMNMFPYAGVKPGLNSLVLSLTRYEDIEIDDVIFDTQRSGIEVTSDMPAALGIDVTAARRPVIVGTTVRVEYVVRNVGNRPAKDVVVRVDVPRGGLQVQGPEQHRLGLLEGRKAVRGRFDLRAIAPGRFGVALFASSSTNDPAGMVEIEVLPR